MELSEGQSIEKKENKTLRVNVFTCDLHNNKYYEEGTVISLLQMRKLRHADVTELAKIIQLISMELGFKLRTHSLNYLL